MINIRSLGFGFAVLALAVVQPALADDHCMDALDGTYLLSIAKSDGSFASRAIVAIDDNGNLMVTDSNQIGASFTLQKGVLACTSDDTAKAITLNFGKTESDGKPDIGRSDWTFTANDGGIEGSVEVVLYQPIDSCDPIGFEGCSPDPVGAFTFAGERLTVE